ncbi:hypothetical protein [Aquimarina spongiae]|uniref:Uncharacterized protein n=1 Tax=Aquimarina spongiae TaxID=570521 RepID=A0A1M6GQ55_9FLAO|nr:hypothetical protein [Aquimarina spongiae]SHJ12049.1 hypothetical protein SAMN04488508_105391 [Aquimarina spongiae]
MSFIQIKRKTKTENRYSQKMGRLITQVTYIQKYCLGLPVQTIHKYRKTYYGKVKSCSDCILEA